ncbi:hypothetical protein [Streptomyces sp. UNOB3_S3]|uniref:hypothetical protein n=1 Tax=Streptomyces sp. UNOB3_S3 TaxID=2871682 RepID=UPI001E447609|nr:hypothetical protein [Streptomyces sp. UNOB3_S3]MCC3774516.1 hypothetical protein [Streptomyces sp. UNOB3_S3]
MDTMEVGSLAMDTQRNRLGEVMAATRERVFLRPLGGGREWEAKPSALRPMTPGGERGRCAGCDRIKRARREATARGDAEGMARAATLMGLHQRETHA